MATHDDFQQEPAPQAKKGSGSKVLLILGTIAGLGLVVCCGGAGVGYYMLKDKIKDAFSMTSDPVEVKQKLDEIITIDVPDQFSPMSAMRISPGVFTMKMIMYQGGANSQSGLVIMEMNQPGADPKQMRDQMLQQMRSQQAQGGGFNSQINVQSKETKPFNINGEATEFDFVKGTRSGDATAMRQIVGTFPGRNGTVLLMVIMPESDYNEEAMLKMIKSIRVPGSAAPTEATSDEEMMEKDEGMTEKEDGAAEESESAPDKSE